MRSIQQLQATFCNCVFVWEADGIGSVVASRGCCMVTAWSTRPEQIDYVLFRARFHAVPQVVAAR